MHIVSKCLFLKMCHSIVLLFYHDIPNHRRYVTHCAMRGLCYANCTSYRMCYLRCRRDVVNCRCHTAFRNGPFLFTFTYISYISLTMKGRLIRPASQACNKCNRLKSRNKSKCSGSTTPMHCKVKDELR